MLWLRPAVCAASVSLLAIPVAGSMQSPAVYVAPQRPACDASLPDGEALRFAYLIPGLNAGSPVTPPWQVLAAAAAEQPERVTAHLDFARCVYTFIRGLDDVKRLIEVEAALVRALAIVRSDLSRPQPPMPVAADLPAHRTGRDVPMPEPRRFKAPNYPAEARRQQISGTVFVDAIIDTSGNVRQARVVGSIPPLDAEAERAVRSWTYRPSMVNGKRVEVAHLVALRFGPVADPVVDRIDIARFQHARGDHAAAHAELLTAISTIQKMRTSISPSAAARLQDLQMARRFKAGSGIVEPKVIRKIEPKYTPQAMANKIVGEVHLDVLILSDGTVGMLRVTQSLDRVFGLDDAAMDAARQWRFQPARDAEGKTMPVIVTLILEFRLH